jgi:hypothetical protein
MTENGNPEKRPDDAPRHHKARELLIDVLSLGMAGLAVSHCKPDGTLAASGTCL